MEGVRLDGVDDGTFAPARQNPDQHAHQYAARHGCDEGARIKLDGRTQPLSLLEAEDCLMHPLRDTADGRDGKPGQDTDERARNDDADFAAANQCACAKGYEQHPQISVMTQLREIHYQTTPDRHFSLRAAATHIASSSFAAGS